MHLSRYLRQLFLQKLEVLSQDHYAVLSLIFIRRSGFIRRYRLNLYSPGEDRAVTAMSPLASIRDRRGHP